MDKIKLRLTGKLMLAVIVIMAVTMSANMYFTSSRVNENEERAFADKLRQITGMATQVRNWAAEHQDLYRTADQMDNGKLDISSVPVVQAWQIAQSYAEHMGFEFRTPSLSPRNPDNMAVGFEREALLAFQKDPSLTEYWKRDRENGNDVMRFAAPVRVGEECLSCHGFPKGEKDPFGYAKEGMKAGELRAAFVVNADASLLAEHESANTQFMLWSTLGIIFLVCGGIFWYTRRLVTRPLSEVCEKMERIAEGDIEQNINYHSNDEIGDVANSFGKMTEYLAEMATAADKIADGDLRVKVTSRSERDALGSSFQKMLVSLTDIVSRLGSSSEQLVSSSNQISASAEQMAAGANSQTDQTAQVSTAIEEMTATVIETSKNAAEATETAARASDIATSGSETVAQTISGMQRIADVVSSSGQTIGELAKSADQIGEIIGVIDDIADQTNLLALNAAIEAARAGEQGRGFAVVADEVRKLAERTTKATAEITEMIKGIQQDTHNAVKSMEEGASEVNNGREMADKAGDALNEILAMNQRVNAMIQQIATAAEEQSSAAEQISRSVDQIANVSRETSKGADESAKATEDLNKQAEGISGLVANFKVS